MEKTCSFCGVSLTRENRANEHVIPKWLLKLLEIERDEQHTSSIRSLEGQVVFQKSFGATNIVFGNVCKECNHGWLSALEADVKIIFERLFKCQPTALTNTESQLLGLWAYKTALLLTRTADEARKNLVRDEALVNLFNTKAVPADAHVSLVTSITDPLRKAHVHIGQPEFRQIDATKASKEEFTALVNSSLGFAVHMQFGPIFLRVISITPRKKWKMNDQNINRFHVLGPEGGNIHWPPEKWLDKSFDDIALGIYFELRHL